jgi:hypothetical protein
VDDELCLKGFELFGSIIGSPRELYIFDIRFSKQNLLGTKNLILLAKDQKMAFLKFITRNAISQIFDFFYFCNKTTFDNYYLFNLLKKDESCWISGEGSLPQMSFVFFDGWRFLPTFYKIKSGDAFFQNMKI